MIVKPSISKSPDAEICGDGGWFSSNLERADESLVLEYGVQEINDGLPLRSTMDYR